MHRLIAVVAVSLFLLSAGFATAGDVPMSTGSGASAAAPAKEKVVKPVQVAKKAKKGKKGTLPFQETK